MRSGIKWREHGERSNKYFYACLQDRQVAKFIPAIANEDGSLATTPDDMVSRAHDFYCKLYQREDIDPSALSNILQAIPEDVSIAEDDQELLAMPWSDDEFLNGISRTPYRSSPGVDGFPYEMLRFLYGHPRVKPLMHQVFNEALMLARTPASWRTSVVTLLPKQGDSTLLKNWRPISLICTDAKVFTRMLNTRMGPLVEKLVNRYQSGFLHKRFIGDNGLLVRLAMSLAQRFDLPGAALLLDQEKAYDRVHPDYLKAVLQRFGFGSLVTESIIQLFFNTRLSINVSGYLSKPFEQQRGLRQGDPLSPLLFNLALEPLLRSLLASPSIHGFSFSFPNAPTPSYYISSPPPPLNTLANADDVLIFISCPEELSHAMTIIDLYCKASNARLNHHKSLAVSLSGKVPDFSAKVLPPIIPLNGMMDIVRLQQPIWVSHSVARTNNLSNFWSLSSRLCMVWQIGYNPVVFLSVVKPWLRILSF